MARCPGCGTSLNTVRQREGLFYCCPRCNGRAVTLPQIRRVAGDLGGWTFVQVELVHAAVFVAALFRRQVEAPSPAIGQDDERDAGMEGVFERLADAVLGLAGRFDFDELSRLGRGMA